MTWKSDDNYTQNVDRFLEESRRQEEMRQREKRQQDLIDKMNENYSEAIKILSTLESAPFINDNFFELIEKLAKRTGEADQILRSLSSQPIKELEKLKIKSNQLKKFSQAIYSRQRILAISNIEELYFFASLLNKDYPSDAIRPAVSLYLKEGFTYNLPFEAAQAMSLIVQSSASLTFVNSVIDNNFLFSIVNAINSATDKKNLRTKIIMFRECEVEPGFVTRLIEDIDPRIDIDFSSVYKGQYFTLNKTKFTAFNTHIDDDISKPLTRRLEGGGLTKVLIHNSRVSDANMAVLSQCIDKNADVSLSDSTRYLRFFIAKNNQLNSLDIDSETITPEHFFQIEKLSLLNLSIKNCPFEEGDYSRVKLPKGLRYLAFDLSTLSNSNLFEVIISQVADSKITSISFNNCNLNDDHLAILCRYLPTMKNLSSLCLSQNNFSPRAIEFLTQSVESTTNITEIQIPDSTANLNSIEKLKKIVQRNNDPKFILQFNSLTDEINNFETKLKRSLNNNYSDSFFKQIDDMISGLKDLLQVNYPNTNELIRRLNACVETVLLEIIEDTINHAAKIQNTNIDQIRFIQKLMNRDARGSVLNKKNIASLIVQIADCQVNALIEHMTADTNNERLADIKGFLIAIKISSLKYSLPIYTKLISFIFDNKPISLDIFIEFVKPNLPLQDELRIYTAYVQLIYDESNSNNVSLKENFIEFICQHYYQIERNVSNNIIEKYLNTLLSTNPQAAWHFANSIYRLDKKRNSAKLKLAYHAYFKFLEPQLEKDYDMCARAVYVAEKAEALGIDCMEFSKKSHLDYLSHCIREGRYKEVISHLPSKEYNKHLDDSTRDSFLLTLLAHAIKQGNMAVVADGIKLVTSQNCGKVIELLLSEISSLTSKGHPDLKLLSRLKNYCNFAIHLAEKLPLDKDNNNAPKERRDIFIRILRAQVLIALRGATDKNMFNFCKNKIATENELGNFIKSNASRIQNLFFWTDKGLYTELRQLQNSAIYKKLYLSPAVKMTPLDSNLEVELPEDPDIESEETTQSTIL